VLDKLFKSAKFLYGWLDWSLLYPLWKTEAGREQIVRVALQYVRKHPEKLQEIQTIISKIMAEDLLKNFAANLKKAADADPSAKGSGEAPFVPDEEVAELPVDLFAGLRDGPAEPPKPKVPKGNGRTMGDLKARLGLKKT